MNQNSNKYIAVSYKLYDITDGKSELLEETSIDRPFDFISGVGIALEAFEEAVLPLGEGEKFDFTLSPDKAYGEYVKERVLELDKNIFSIDGKFDSEHVTKGAVLPLQNADGNRFNGLVLDITDNNVVIDLNHPLAGKTLRFTGAIEKSREASAEEVGAYIDALKGHHCGGHCGGGCGGHCEGGCDGEHHKDGDCGCGGDGECCGGCGK